MAVFVDKYSGPYVSRSIFCVTFERFLILFLSPLQILTNVPTTHVRIMRHVLTVRGVINVSVQPGLKEKTAVKVTEANQFILQMKPPTKEIIRQHLFVECEEEKTSENTS